MPSGPLIFGAALAAPAAPQHPSAFQETYWLLIALGVAVGTMVAVQVLRSRKGGKAYVDRLKAGLKPSEVFLRVGEASRLQTCWHCGARPIARRPVRLFRSIFGGIMAGGESLTLEVPLCAEHGEVNVGSHWVRLLAAPVGVLVAVISMAAYPFREGSGHFRWWLPLSLAAGIAVGALMRRWANRRQTFRLTFLDTAETSAGHFLGNAQAPAASEDIVIVRFNDPARAASVREDLAATAD